MPKKDTQGVREPRPNDVRDADTEPNEARRRSRPTIKWRIAHKLTLASVLMVLLTVVAGGVGLWQVFTIDQVTKDTRAAEEQRARSLELLAAGHRLIAALNRMVFTENPLLASTEVAESLGTLDFYMESLQASEEEVPGEMQAVYDELRQAVSQVDLLVRQERWTDAGVALEQQLKPLNDRMNLFIRRLVQQTDQEAKTATSRAQSVVRQAVLRLVVLTVLTTGIALGWRQFVFRGLSLSITQLRQGVARISSGDLSHELDIRTRDEIEELGNEFNKMARELANLIRTLERRVAERTQGLQTAAEVSRATTSLLDPKELLDQVVDLVQERFNLYYVGLFLLDEAQQIAVLRAGTGKAGQQMVAQGHSLAIGGESMIGQCVARSEARIALDVGVEAVRFDNPFLPKTRSELALPLRSRDRVIGAMTIQSVEQSAFDETDIAVMQTVADQVAVAIDNARLFAETQAALKEAEATQQRYLRRAWGEYLQLAQATAYEVRRQDEAPLGDAVLPEIRQALERRDATVLTDRDAEQPADDGRERDYSTLVTPITLRGEVVGVLGFQDDEPSRQWTEDEIALVQITAERMALAAENLRLLDETQRYADRERLVGELTTRMHEALDVNTVLQTTVRAIGETLDLTEVQVRMGIGSTSGTDGKDNQK